MGVVDGKIRMSRVMLRPRITLEAGANETRARELVAKAHENCFVANSVSAPVDLPAVGASSLPVRAGTRVDLLKGGEFLRISVKRDRERYLIYLPVMP
jgi:hypothetical protein